MKPRQNESRFMSTQDRLTIVEASVLNINATLVDIKQDAKRLSDKIDLKFSAVDKEFESMHVKFAEIHTQLAVADTKFDAIDRRFEAIDKKFEAVDKRFDSLENKIDNKFNLLNNRIWSTFLWQIGMMIGLAGLIAHTQHWI